MNIKKVKQVLGILLCFAIILGMTPVPSAVYAADTASSYAGGTRDISTDEGTVLIPFTKTWDDDNDSQGFRPDAIALRLYKYSGTFDQASATLIASATVNADDGWTHTFDISDENIFDDSGNVYKFKIVEEEIDNYSETAHTDPVVRFTPPSADGAWNRITPCSQLDITTSGTYKSVVVMKKGNEYVFWTVDALTEAERTVLFTSARDNIEGCHGAKIDNATFISGTTGSYGGMTVTTEHITFDDPSVWSFFATGLYEKSSTEANAAAITNKYIPETVDVAGSKTWDDANNQDNKRPESITINLLSDGVKTDSKIVTAADNWSWNFSGLPKYKNGKLISYKITEAQVENYDTEYHGYNVTNRYTPGKVSVSVLKSWNDNDDQDGIRPDTVTVKLLADGETVEGKTLELSAANGWEGSFEDLDEYSSGQKIVYTIAEIDLPEGYSSTISGDAESGFEVTNEHTPELVSLDVSKEWIDAENQDGIRPDSVTFGVYNGDKLIAKKKVTKDCGWKCTFEGLQKYDAGELIEYSIKEDTVNGYTVSIEGNPAEGFTVTNTHTPALIKLDVTKSWDDADDQDGIRPGSISVQLLADGTAVEGKTLSLDAANGWKVTFKDLPKYKEGAEGQKITYTVEEADTPTGYTAVVSGNQEFGFVIKNSHVPEKTDVSGMKTWNDADDQDGKRPESITVDLIADGTVVKSAAVTSADNWSWSFNDLPKYKEGKEINYTINEKAVAGYETEVDGYNITNTHAPEKTDIRGSKTWNDMDDHDGIRPDSITVRLLADGEEADSMTVTADENWSWEFKGLDKFSGGREIKYTIEEDAVEGYTAAVNGFNVTNTHMPKTMIPVTKVWMDDNDKDGMRPDSVTVQLIADGTAVAGKTLTLGKDNDWTASFTDLPKFKSGKEVVYTVSELEVKGYKAEIEGSAADGFIITNTHTPKPPVKPEAPKTGDNSNVALWGLLLLTSALEAAFLIRRKKIDHR